MKRYFSQIIVGAALAGVGALASAAPVTYTFSTSQVSPGGFGAGASFLSGALSGLSVTGTFNYDASAAPTATSPAGATFYGGPASPYSGLHGSVGAFSFSDPRGFASVANDRPISIFPAADSFQLVADSSVAASGVHNISGFVLGGYTLYNVRMFWIEGDFYPELVADFLGDQNLPNPLPTFHGRLALDFVVTGSPAGPQSDVFFDGLSVTAVPEPESYAMLLAGLGLLGFAARRRTLKEAAFA
jgi:hypothetical protein